MKNKLTLFLAAITVSASSLIISPEASASYINPKEHVVEAEKKTHWITTSSGIRHNKSCRWYRNSKGRPCTKSEGRACKKCGG